MSESTIEPDISRFKQKNINVYDNIIFKLFKDKLKYNNLKDFLNDDKPEPYIPKKELSKRPDVAFYRAIFPEGDIGILADFDDLVQGLVKKHPDTTLHFNFSTQGLIVPQHPEDTRAFDDFWQQIKRFKIKPEKFNIEESKMRIEERNWYQTVERISQQRSITLFDLPTLLPTYFSTRSLGRQLTPDQIQTIKSFCRARSQFWHPDKWKKIPLDNTQQARIHTIQVGLNLLQGLALPKRSR